MGCTHIHKIPNLVRTTEKKKSQDPYRKYIVLINSGRTEAELGRHMIMAIYPTQGKTGNDGK